MDDKPLESWGNFHFADHPEGPQSGFITNFIGPDGAEVNNPHDAVAWIGYVTQGSLAGKWLNCPIDDQDEFEPYVLH